MKSYYHGLALIWHMILILMFLVHPGLCMLESRKKELQSQVVDAFDHGWKNYLRHAWPYDELQPLSCKGRGSDFEDPTNIGINDVCGDYQLTLIDSLDTLAVSSYIFHNLFIFHSHKCSFI